jgi:hypothetical protein
MRRMQGDAYDCMDGSCCMMVDRAEEYEHDNYKCLLRSVLLSQSTEKKLPSTTSQTTLAHSYG